MNNKKISGKVLYVQLGRDETRIALFDGVDTPSLTLQTPAGAVGDGVIQNMDAVRAMLKSALQQPEFKTVLATLIASPSIRECSDVFVKIFEKPADQSEAVLRQRAEFGRAMYQEFSKGEAEDPEGIPDDKTIKITEEDLKTYTKAVLIVKTLKDLLSLLQEA